MLLLGFDVRRRGRGTGCAYTEADMLPLERPSASSAVREAALMRPAHRCRADGGLRFVVHAYGRRKPWGLSRRCVRFS